MANTLTGFVLGASLAGGGGEGGTSNYNQLQNKPQINGIELLGNKTSDELNIASKDDLDELKLFKFPNATIIGNPTINNGQISDFSINDYLEFPFLVDFRGRSFEINFALTTGSQIVNQENILDSDFGLAFAIRNKHIILALSFNGTSWATEQTGALELEENSTYRFKIVWNGLSYKVQYSIDGGTTYFDDITFGSNQAPYPKQMFIGVGKLANNHFTGIINLNYANVKIGNEIIWQGMDDVGLATRLATDVSNIDAAGIEKIKEIAGGSGSSYTLSIPTTDWGDEQSLQIRKTLIDYINDYLNNYEPLDRPSNNWSVYRPGINGRYSNYTTIFSSIYVRTIPQYNIYSIKLRFRYFEDDSIYSSTAGNTSKFKYRDVCCYITSDEYNSKNVTKIYSSTNLANEGFYTEASTSTYNMFIGQQPYLGTQNTVAYTPTNDYHPTTKKYVDDRTPKVITLSEAEYNALTTYEDNTEYHIY